MGELLEECIIEYTVMREAGWVAITSDFRSQLQLQRSIGEFLFSRKSLLTFALCVFKLDPEGQTRRTQTQLNDQRSTCECESLRLLYTVTPTSFYAGQMWLLRGRDPISSRRVASRSFPERNKVKIHGVKSVSFSTEGSCQAAASGCLADAGIQKWCMVGGETALCHRGVT